MAILDTTEWAQVTFGECALGDQRRTKRLVKLAEQVAARPACRTPRQTESWGDCKAAYRLFDQDDVTFAEIISAALSADARGVSAGRCETPHQRHDGDR